MTRRDAGVDLLRVVAIVAVVVGHVVKDDTLHRWLYIWHMPLFFMLTGWFWTAGRLQLQLASSRIRSMMLPYAAWFVITALVASIPGAHNRIDWPQIVNGLLGGSHAKSPFTVVWFFTVLLFLVLAYRLIERVPMPAQGAIAVAAIGLGIVAGPQLAATPLAIGSTLPCLAFVIAGRALRMGASHLTPLRGVVVGAAATAAMALVFAIAPLGTLDVKYGDYGTPFLTPLVSVVACGGLILVARALPIRGMAGDVTTALARVGLAVVLAHPVVMWIATAIGLPTPVTLVAALIVPWAIALALQRTPMSQLLVGVARQRPAVAPA